MRRAGKVVSREDIMIELWNSDAFIDGKYVGLLLDEVNHADLTDERIREWTALIR